MHEENDVAENSAAEGVLCWTSVSGVVNALDKFCFLCQFAYQASCACHLLVPVPVWVTVLVLLHKLGPLLCSNLKLTSDTIKYCSTVARNSYCIHQPITQPL